ncbi:MAG: hypothetical protein O2820_17800 [Planctomycetota bacterium]|nr:hypothetical protein [Planctomycetota bacterium]
MRIRSTNRTPYLSRRDQLRLGIFAALMGFVVLAMQQASRPESWYWLTGVPGLQPESKVESPVKAQPKVDFSVDAEEETLPKGVVRVVQNVPKPDLNSNDPESGTQAGPSETDLIIDPELLAQIKDNSVGIRDSERDLHYFMLAKARDTPLEMLEKSARDDVAFSVLMNESPKFIGQLLTIKGELRGLRPYGAGRNEHGVDHLYEAWIKTLDAGDNPYRVLCSRIPQGIPQGMEIEPGTVVKITGYYFKRYGYPAHDHRLHVAPLILAPEVYWFRQRPARDRNAEDGGIVPYILGLAAIVGSIIAILLWQFRKSDREFERQHLKRFTAAPQGAIESLDGLATVDVHDALRQLAEADSGMTSPPPVENAGRETEVDEGETT